MADVLTFSTNTDATSADIISSLIQDALIQKELLTPLVGRYQAGPGMKQVEIPKSDLPSVQTKTEGTAMDAQALTWSTDILALNQHKAIQYLVEDFARLQANPALMSDMIDKAAQKIAEARDAFVYGLIAATSSTAPDHRVAYQAAQIGEEDILEARKLLNQQSVPQEQRYLAISPTSEKAMLQVAGFVDADKFGAGAPRVNGFLGRVYGFDVVMSNNVADLGAVCWHPSHVAFAEQQGVKFEMIRDLANLADRVSLSHIYGGQTLDGGKRGVLLGSAL